MSDNRFWSGGSANFYQPSPPVNFQSSPQVGQVSYQQPPQTVVTGVLPSSSHQQLPYGFTPPAPLFVPQSPHLPHETAVPGYFQTLSGPNQHLPTGENLHQVPRNSIHNVYHRVNSPRLTTQDVMTSPRFHHASTTQSQPMLSQINATQTVHHHITSPQVNTPQMDGTSPAIQPQHCATVAPSFYHPTQTLMMPAQTNVANYQPSQINPVYAQQLPTKPPPIGWMSSAPTQTLVAPPLNQQLPAANCVQQIAQQNGVGSHPTEATPQSDGVSSTPTQTAPVPPSNQQTPNVNCVKQVVQQDGVPTHNPPQFGGVSSAPTQTLVAPPLNQQLPAANCVQQIAQQNGVGSHPTEATPQSDGVSSTPTQTAPVPPSNQQTPNVNCVKQVVQQDGVPTHNPPQIGGVSSAPTPTDTVDNFLTLRGDKKKITEDEFYRLVKAYIDLSKESDTKQLPATGAAAGSVVDIHEGPSDQGYQSEETRSTPQQKLRSSRQGKSTKAIKRDEIPRDETPEVINDMSRAAPSDCSNGESSSLGLDEEHDPRAPLCTSTPKQPTGRKRGRPRKVLEKSETSPCATMTGKIIYIILKRPIQSVKEIY